MSYAADQIAKRLQFCSVAQRFNIMSAILPVITSLRAFGTTPAADIVNKILGIPLDTILAEFEEHALRRTPVLTSWVGQQGADGFDIFGACPLRTTSPTTRYVPHWTPATTAYGVTDDSWFALPVWTGRSDSVGLWGAPPYARASRDGFFMAGGYARVGVAAWNLTTNPLGDAQNTSPLVSIDMDARGSSGGSGWSVQPLRSSAIGVDGSHTYGPNGFGFTNSGLQSVPSGSQTQRCWSAFSMSGGSTPTMRGLTKVQNIASPSIAADTVVDLASNFDPMSNKVQKLVRFGAGPSANAFRLNSGVFEGFVWTHGSSLSMTYAQLGGFYLGRRGISTDDIQKLYYSPSATLCIWLRPWQDPLRAVGYLESMSHQQISRLLDGIAAGTIDPQTATPAQVWDAVR